MKARLEFDLPEERYEFEHANKGCLYKGLLDEIYTHLRGKVKYGELSEAESKVYNEFFDWFIDTLNNEGVDLFHE